METIVHISSLKKECIHTLRELTKILLVVLVIVCHAFCVLLVSHALHQQQVHVLMVPLVYKERTRVILVNPDFLYGRTVVLVFTRVKLKYIWCNCMY